MSNREKGTTERLRDVRLTAQVRLLDLLRRSASLLKVQHAAVFAAERPGGPLACFQVLGTTFRLGAESPELSRIRDGLQGRLADAHLTRDLSREPWAGGGVPGIGAALLTGFRLSRRWHVVVFFDPTSRRRGFSERDEDLLRVASEGTRALLERVQVEEELRRTDERFRRFFHVSQLGTAILDPDGRWSVVNARLAGLLERTNLELRKLTWREVTAPSDLEREQALFASMIAGEIEEYRTEKSFVRPNGTSFPALVSTRLLRRSSGEPDAVIALIEDLSERRRILEEQRQLQQQLLQAQKVESLGLLAGGIAHDFNNLLTGVLGNAHLIQLELGTEHAAAAPLAYLLDAAQRAANLTRQLLAYSGQRGVRVRALDLSHEVQDLSSLLDRLIPKQVELRLDLGVQVPPVQADEVQVQQVVMNLVLNGAEAVGERGTVWIRTGKAFLDPLTVTGFAVPPPLEGTYSWVEVLDTGSGIPPEVIGKIFDPFFSTKFTGRGLGLAAVSGIVRGHKGAIRVQSTPGQGSVFCVYFPGVSEVEERPPEAESAREERRVALVVDDEGAVRRVCCSVLERGGWEPHAASSGAEGVALGRRLRPGLAILDMTMPDIDGVETARQLRELLPELPVLFMSGYAEAAIRARVPADARYGFIHKPFTPQQLIQAVEDTVADARSGSRRWRRPE